MTPISAKNTKAIETLAALKRRLRNTLTSSIGWSVRRSQAMNAAMIAAPAAKAAEDHRAAPAALGRLDQGPDDGAEAGDRQAGAGQVDLRRLGVARVRHEHGGADQARDHDGQVDQEDAAPGEVLDQEAAGDRPERDAEPGHRGPGGDRLRALVRRGRCWSGSRASWA